MLQGIKGVNVINRFIFLRKLIHFNCDMNAILYIIFHIRIFYHYSRIIYEMASGHVTCYMWGWIFLHNVGETGEIHLR